MSIWHNIADESDVEVSEDGATLEVLYLSDEQGNHYVDIPIEFVRLAFERQDKV